MTPLLDQESATKDLMEQARRAIGARKSSDLASLLERGLDPDAYREWPLLAQAAKRGYAKGVKLLLPRSNPLGQDAGGRTALMWAASHGRADCVKLLLPFGGAELVDNLGRNALMLAVRDRDACSLECVQLLAPVSDSSAVDAHGASVLGAAIGLAGDDAKHAEIVAFLAARPDAPKRLGEEMTPLMAAITYKSTILARALLPHSDLAAVNSAGQDALFLAVVAQKSDLIPFMIPHCANESMEEAMGLAIDSLARAEAMGFSAEMVLEAAETIEAFEPFLSDEKIKSLFAPAQTRLFQFAENVPKLFARREAVIFKEEVAAANGQGAHGPIGPAAVSDGSPAAPRQGKTARL